METDEERIAPAPADNEAGEDWTSFDEVDGVDDSGTGAAVALVVALLSFVLAVTFIILRHVLFQA